MTKFFEMLKGSEPVVVFFYVKKILIALCLTILLMMIIDRVIPTDINKVTVFVVKSNLTAGQVLNMENVMQKEIDNANVPSNMFNDEKEFVGKKTAIDLVEGQILGSNLIANNSISYIENGKVAMSINISNTSKSNIFISGDIINLATVDAVSNKTLYLAHNAKVLPNSRDVENENNYLVSVTTEESELITKYFASSSIVGILVGSSL
jgi:Flp pilus assembly protein CpaB